MSERRPFKSSGPLIGQGPAMPTSGEKSSGQISCKCRSPEPKMSLV